VQDNGGDAWPAFSPDGLSLLVGSMETGQVSLWRVNLDDVIRTICSRTWLDLTPDERLQYDIQDEAPSCPALTSSSL
jgi:hypothetical protein